MVAPPILWLYGFSGAGKSTLATHLCTSLSQQGKHAFNLDGDILRSGLNSDLGFSEKDRTENLRRAAELAKIIQSQGIYVVASFITPVNSDRDLIDSILGNSLRWVFVNTPLQVCEFRDPKGLYLKARSGAISNFTGISAPFEVSELHNHLEIDTSKLSIQESVAHLLQLYS
jgi:adenylyl-sulfate kinase